MFTLLGDANLDGNVNPSDFAPFSTNLNDTNAAQWNSGDFNYDGTVNTEDFTPFAHDLNQTESIVLDSSNNAPDGINVPEPASLGLLAIGSLGILARRRRQSPL